MKSRDRANSIGGPTTVMRAAVRGTLRVRVDPIACEAFGYCAELLGEIVSVDEWGYPIADDGPVPPGLVAMAKKAARDCPRRALLLSEDPDPARS